MSETAEDEHINRVRAAAAKRKSLQSDLDHAKARLREQIRQGLDEGLTASDLAAASGLPPEEIQQIGLSRPTP